MLKEKRSDAKSAGDLHYFTGRPCKNGHIEKRLTSTGGCLACYREMQAKRRSEDHEYKARQDAARDAWAKSERGKMMSRASVQRRRETIRQQDRARRLDGRYKPKRREHYHRVLKACPQYRIRHNIGTRLRGLLKGDVRGKTITRIVKVCGYSISDLRRHLELQFLAGMSWENYGRDGWHIDHITPVSAFDQTDDEQFAACWGLPNLRPMWASDNIRKSATKTHLL